MAINIQIQMAKEGLLNKFPVSGQSSSLISLIEDGTISLVLRHKLRSSLRWKTSLPEPTLQAEFTERLTLFAPQGLSAMSLGSPRVC